MNPLSASSSAYSNRKESIEINNQLELSKNQVIVYYIENNNIPWAIKNLKKLSMSSNICDGKNE